MKTNKYILGLIAALFSVSLYAQVSTDEIEKFFEKKSDPKVVRYQKILKEASEHCFLIYMFNGSEKQSADFAPTVKQFATRYGWKVIGITLDGKQLEGFEDIKEDNGISRSFDINLAPPAVAIVNPEKGESYLISCGVVSLNQLEDAIMKKFELEIKK